MNVDSANEVLHFPDEGIIQNSNPTSLNTIATHNHGDHPLIDIPDDLNSFSVPELTRYVALGVDMNLHGFDAFLRSNDESNLPSFVIEKVREYEKGLLELREYVSSSEAQEKLEEASSKYIREDIYALPENITQLRKDNKRKIFFDFDGTISDPSRRGDSPTDSFLAGSDPIDYYLGHERSKFKYAAAVWEEEMNRHPEIFRAGGEQTQLREGMMQLLETLLGDPNCEVGILTTNFLPFMEGFLSRIKGGEKIKLFCVRNNDIQSTAKGDLLKKIAIDDPAAVIEYIGDGATDMPTVEAASVVGVYHSVEGLGFDVRLSEKSIAHLPFKDVSQLTQNLGLTIAA